LLHSTVLLFFSPLSTLFLRTPRLSTFTQKPSLQVLSFTRGLVAATYPWFHCCACSPVRHASNWLYYPLSCRLNAVTIVKHTRLIQRLTDTLRTTTTGWGNSRSNYQNSIPFTRHSTILVSLSPSLRRQASAASSRLGRLTHIQTCFAVLQAIR
jgi:hypothetical protein